MAHEALYIESWIYSTLSGDSDLTDALAAVTSEAPGYQQGVYMHLAPQPDPISYAAPDVPYIVVTREDIGEDTMAIDGERARVDLTYRVTIWDAQNGAVAMDRIIDVADRVDALLHAQASTGSVVYLSCRRVRTGTEIESTQGGAVYYGAFGIYKFEVEEV